MEKKIIIPIILVSIEIIIQHNYSIALEKSWIFFFFEFLQKLDSGYPSTVNIIKLKKKNNGSLERSELN